MTLQEGLMYNLQCQTNTAPESLTITTGSMTHDTTQENSTYYTSDITVDTFTGMDITVQCNWSVSGVYFTGRDIIEGGWSLIYSLVYYFQYNSSIFSSYCITSQYDYHQYHC